MVSVASSLPTDASGPGSWPATTSGSDPHAGQSLDVAAGHQVGDPVPLELGQGTVEVAGELDRAVGVGQAEVARVEPFGGEHGQRDLPALADRAQPQVVGELDPVEVDLVEGAAAGHLADRPDRDARGVHRHQEDGEARVLGRRRVGAGHRDAQVGDRGAGGPHLVAVEDPVARRARRPGCARRRGRSLPRSRRTAGRRSGRCAASPARSGSRCSAVPHCSTAGATSCWVTENISVRRGTSNASSCCRKLSAYDVGRLRPPYSSGQVSAPQPGVVLRLLVGADPVGLGALLVGGPVLEDRDRVRTDAPLRGGTRLGDRRQPLPRSGSEVVEVAPEACPSSSSDREHRARADARGPVDVGEADPRDRATWRAPASPRSWVTTSCTWRRPEAPMGSPLAMQPPSVLTGSRPPISVSPPATIASCSPSLQKPHSARCMTSAPLSVSCSWATSTSSRVRHRRPRRPRLRRRR